MWFFCSSVLALQPPLCMIHSSRRPAAASHMRSRRAAIPCAALDLDTLQQVAVYDSVMEARVAAAEAEAADLKAQLGTKSSEVETLVSQLAAELKDTEAQLATATAELAQARQDVQQLNAHLEAHVGATTSSKAAAQKAEQALSAANEGAQMLVKARANSSSLAHAV